jgi:CMP-N-acetylneuraminic acid synthetase
VLAIVPARAGSKRLPGKNLKEIAGHSLIGWAVSAGSRASLVDQVILSTDSTAMLVEGMRYGALPHMRPKELATDTASTDAVLYHVMEQC